MSDTDMHVVAVPMLQGGYIDHLLGLRLVEHRFWNRGKVAHGLSPMPHREAREMLRGYYDTGAYSTAPVVIESPLTFDEMHDLVASLKGDDGFESYVFDAMPRSSSQAPAEDSAFSEPMSAEDVDRLEAFGDLLDRIFVTDRR